MGRVFNDLPSEIVENVLVRLPVHVLCRFRLVCKAWNHLITSPRFASSCAELPRQASYVLIMPRELHLCRSTQSTSSSSEILDIAEKRFYSFSDSFIAHYLRRTSRDFRHFIPCAKYALAADGGLVYEMYSKYETQRHIVCNPVSKDIHRIPEPKHRVAYARDLVVMSVDSATQSYRIVIMQSDYRRPAHRGGVYLYDSTTLKWRTLCKVPGDGYCAHSSIFLKGALVTLFFDVCTIPWCPKLYACDLEGGDWSFIDVDLPRLCHPQDRLQLVVSLDRLFLVQFTGGPSSDMTIWEEWSYMKHRKRKLCHATISEILFREREVKNVAEMPEYLEDVHPRVGDKCRSPALMGSPVVAFGCGDSIVVSSLVAGCCLGFDLLKKCWHDPSTDVEHMYGTCKRDLDRGGMCASLVHLDLRKMSS